MPDFFINGEPVSAAPGQTVLEAARDHGIYVPGFCWHPQLSIAGNCRMCLVEVEGRGLDIACNMPVSAGMKVLTESEDVRAHRKAILQFITLNHPVDCGICDKAGECQLQDYHYQYNGAPSLSSDPKVRSTKFYHLSDRIVLDNERCILCLRCTRFTHEVSKSKALGIERRGDISNVRPSPGCTLDDDPYSDNIVDLCPVGALLARDFLYKSRVWYLEPTPSVCPGCARGCTVQLWHRKREWALQALDPGHNARIERVTPLENPAVNGPWICNKGRDLGKLFGQARSTEPMLKGRAVTLAEAVAAARALIAGARRPVALVSNWGSNEELQAFQQRLGARFTAYAKTDCQPQPGERLEDELLIRDDKNPNTAGVRALFAPVPATLPADADLVLVWGEGCDFGALPRGAKTVLLGSWLRPENGHADVFVPLSLQTERDGHYTNFAGVVSPFSACAEKPAGVAHAATLFAQLAADGERA